MAENERTPRARKSRKIVDAQSDTAGGAGAAAQSDGPTTSHDGDSGGPIDSGARGASPRVDDLDHTLNARADEDYGEVF